SIRNSALFVQPGKDAIMNVGSGPLIHDLGLTLRIKILRNVTHDPEQLALPGLQARRRLFQEIQQIFLREPQQLAPPFDVKRLWTFGRARRNGTPEIIERLLLVQTALSGASFFSTQIQLLLAGITIDPMRHQSVSGVQRDRKSTRLNSSH